MRHKLYFRSFCTDKVFGNICNGNESAVGYKLFFRLSAQLIFRLLILRLRCFFEQFRIIAVHSTVFVHVIRKAVKIRLRAIITAVKTCQCKRIIAVFSFSSYSLSLIYEILQYIPSFACHCCKMPFTDSPISSSRFSTAIILTLYKSALSIPAHAL